MMLTPQMARDLEQAADEFASLLDACAGLIILGEVLGELERVIGDGIPCAVLLADHVPGPCAACRERMHKATLLEGAATFIGLALVGFLA